METIYYLINNLRIKSRFKNFDYNTPVNISSLHSAFPTIIQYKDWTQVKIDCNTQELMSLIGVSNKKILFELNELIINGVMDYTSSIAISSDELLKINRDADEGLYIFKEIDALTVLIVCPSNLFIYLPGAGNPKYYIEETNEFGAITDKEFNIIAFVIRGITFEEIESLKNYAERNPPIEPIELPLALQHLERNYPMMEDRAKLITTILELENVNYWHLIYFGLERALINNTLIVEFACEYLASGKITVNDKLTLEIASLLKNEIEQASELLTRSIPDQNEILVKQGRLYNKIWMYLSLAIDMKKLNVVKNY